jgi:hypothetical protein
MPDPMYTCGHLIGSGVHRSREAVDACVAYGQERASIIKSDIERSRHPLYRSGSISLTCEGAGVGARAVLTLFERQRGMLDAREMFVWQVRYFADNLRPSWGFERADILPDPHGLPGRVQDFRVMVVGLDSFDAALSDALADASSDLHILTNDVDRRGTEEA